MAEIVEERINFASGPLQLTGILSYPDQAAPKLAVLVCSPHPHFAGDMDNNVVRAVAERLARHSVVLRFDYRGVGESEIALETDVSVFDYWTEIEETRDYRDPVTDVEAAAQALASATESFDVGLCVVGYSFGAATGMLFGCETNRVIKMVALAPPLGKVSFDFLSTCLKPSLHLVGKNDFLYSDEGLKEYRQAVGPAAKVVVLSEADHFFRGGEDMLAQEVDRFLRDTHEA
jgi:alpha/beta superfamily hydrolase